MDSENPKVLGIHRTIEKFPDQLDQGARSTNVVCLIGKQILDNSHSEAVRLNLPYQM